MTHPLVLRFPAFKETFHQAIGPTLGALMIRTTNNLLSVFYLATGVHILYTLLAISIIPESLTRASMRRARKRREALRNKQETALEHPNTQSRAVVMKARLWSYIRVPFAFLAPLSIFLPHRRPDGKGWDLNLTLLVLSNAFAGLLMASHL
jgi:hypothetical protein